MIAQALPCGNAAPLLLAAVLPTKPPPKLNAGLSVEGGAAAPPNVLNALGLVKLPAVAALPPPPVTPPVNKGLANWPSPPAG